MKRILSIFLCVAMLTSMVAMTVSAFGAYVDQVDANSENVMTITTDKESYLPGETVVITAAMESIWGDPEIADDFEGYEGVEMPGAYGMLGICATLIYDTNMFKAKASTSLLGSSTILNADVATFDAPNALIAGQSGSICAKALAAEIASSEEAWGFLNGSGDLWQYNLTINADAPAGTYYLPIGPYMIYRDGDQGKTPVIKFDEATDPEGRQWAWLGQSTSWGNTTAGLGHDADVRYETGYTGGSRVAADSPMGAEYECSYVEIVIAEAGESGGEDNPDNPDNPPVVENPMEFELVIEDSALVPGDTVTADLKVKNNAGIDDASFTLTYDNFDLKLTGITADEALGTIDANIDGANAQGSFDKVGTDTELDVYFEGASAAFTEDGTIATLTFEVLPTAEAGDSAITAVIGETGDSVTANANIAGEHAHAFEDVIVEAKCGPNGNTGSESKVCSCGLNFLIRTIDKPACVKDTENPKVIVPTCLTEGYTVYTCKVCGSQASTENRIDALGHDIVVYKSTEQSCTTPKAEYKKCQREGCKYTEDFTDPEFPALGHQYPEAPAEWTDEYIVVKPTTDTVGYYGVRCERCGDTKTMQIIPVVEGMKGDVNMDGVINLDDVIDFLKVIAGWEGVHFSASNADVIIDTEPDKPIRTNMPDVTRLLQYIAGWDVVLGEVRKPM